MESVSIQLPENLRNAAEIHLQSNGFAGISEFTRHALREAVDKSDMVRASKDPEQILIRLTERLDSDDVSDAFEQADTSEEFYRSLVEMNA